MTLDGCTKENLKFMLDTYRTKKADLAFFYESIAILNQDSLFQNRLKSRVVDHIYSMSTFPKTLEVRINPQSNEKEIEKSIRELIKFQPLERQIQVFNLFFIFAILHEVKHFNQIEIALDRIPAQDSIKKAHLIWYEFVTLPMSLQNQRRYELYNQYHNFMFFEREANIVSLKIIGQLFDDSLLKNYCNRNLVANYKLGYMNKGPFTRSPVEYTCNLLGSSFDITTKSNLSFMERFETGFPLDENEYQCLVDTFSTRFESNEEIIKSLKKIA